MLAIGLILIIVAILLYKKPQKGVKVTSGQKLTPQEQAANYRSLRNFIERHPDYEINSQFPEILKDISISKEYTELNRKFDSGEISYADYQIELNDLLNKMGDFNLRNH